MKQITLYTDNVKELLSLSNTDAGILFKALIQYKLGYKGKLQPGLDEMLQQLIKINSDDLSARKLRFGLQLAEKCPNEAKETLRAFYDYWTEHNDGGKKMRFEKEKVFDIVKRMRTWKKNNFNGAKSAVTQVEPISISTRMTD